MRIILGFSVILVACASSVGAVVPPAHDDARADPLPVTRLDCPLREAGIRGCIRRLCG